MFGKKSKDTPTPAPAAPKPSKPEADAPKPKPEVPARFASGGATAEEIAAWKAANGR